MKNLLLFTTWVLASVLIFVASGCEVKIESKHTQQTTTACPNGQCPLTNTSNQAINWQTAPREIPAMNLPMALRQHNWGTGSCVHASTVMCLRWQNQLEWADWWRQTYSGGESLPGLVDKMEHNGLDYAFTADGDPAFLDWATRTHRGAVIFYFSNHSICFCGHHDGKAWLLDNNREDHYLTVEWSEFVQNWKGYGGVALTPIYSPPPPLPYL